MNENTMILIDYSDCVIDHVNFSFSTEKSSTEANFTNITLEETFERIINYGFVKKGFFNFSIKNKVYLCFCHNNKFLSMYLTYKEIQKFLETKKQTVV